MFGGPLLVRELLTTPRKIRHYGLRAGYVATLAILMYTAAQATFSLTPLRTVGDIAVFGEYLFQLLSVVQLFLVGAAALLFSAGSIAQEKDRRTLILLIMTDLRATELVIGKSLASTLMVLVLIAVSLPVLAFLRILGGITLGQVIWVELICLATTLAAAAWGTLVAYWREKTFQSIAVTLLGAALFIGLTETVYTLAGAETAVGQACAALNPFRALNSVLHPLAAQPNVIAPAVNATGTLVSLGLLAVGLWGWTCWKVRVWNPSRNVFIQVDDGPVEQAAAAERKSSRTIWSHPVLWREICTQAYGKKAWLIKLGYFLIAMFCLLWLNSASGETPVVFGTISAAGFVFVLLSIASLFLVNAQAVTSLTSERDGQTLELLLVTEVTAREFVFSKLGGILFNTKEIIAVPMLYLLMNWVRHGLTGSEFMFSLVGYIVLVAFAAMLGLHAGLSFDNSREAILNSLGTMFFLFVGIFICMMLIVEARTSFMLQLWPFFAFIGGGSVGLWSSLTHKNPSQALGWSAGILPFLTFYAVVSFLLGNAAEACLAIVTAYGWTAISMLVPAVSAFDVALGRTTIDRG